MSNDLLMLRGETPGEFNLAVGEPVFLQQKTGFTGWRPVPVTDARYPAYGGDPQLIDMIRASNRRMKKHIVITNGAKQAISAALYAFKKVENKYILSTKAPYWPSYPTLAELAGYKFTITPSTGGGVVKVITSPNNPDGHQTMEDCDLWDAAYAHAVYGLAVVPNARVSVWSAAKMFGLSGLRIGALTTDDDKLAEAAREYVEKATSGVCYDAQRRLYHLLEMLKNVSRDWIMKDYMNARLELIRNGEIFNKHLATYMVEMRGVPVTGSGMFAWVRPGDTQKFEAALQKARVRAIPGRACGVDGWFRFSMGQLNGYTERACEALVKEL